MARGEVLLTGFVFPALFCGVGSVVGGVCCLDAGVIFRVWGRAPLVTVRFIGQSPMQLAAPHLAPLPSGSLLSGPLRTAFSLFPGL